MKKMFGLAAAVLIAAGCAVSANADAAGLSSVSLREQNVSLSEADLAEYANRVAVLVNNERRSRGVPELRVLPKLQTAAQIRATEITSVFDHVRPDGRKGFTVLGDLGQRYYYVGENIAAGQSTPEIVMQSWMNSEGHRANILLPEFMYIGVGVTQKNGTIYWSQIFMQHDEYADAYYPTAQKCGDVNSDGKVDSKDASAILSEYGRLSSGAAASFSAEQKKAGDVDGNSMNDSKDASYVLGYYSYLSAGGTVSDIKQWMK